MKPKIYVQWFILIGALFVMVGMTLNMQDSSTGHYYNNVLGHYPNIAGKLGAPDGIYEAQIIRVFNDSTVQMPLCEHSLGQLHGVWKFDNRTVDFNGYPAWSFKMYRVTLSKNIIVQVEEINE